MRTRVVSSLRRLGIQVATAATIVAVSLPATAAPPGDPTQPQPAQPAPPTQPAPATQPASPASPAQPAPPVQPAQPAQPAPAGQPAQPVPPTQPAQPAPAYPPPQPTQPAPPPPPPSSPHYADAYAAGQGQNPPPGPVAAPAPLTDEELRAKELKKMKNSGVSMTAAGFSVFGATYLLSAIIGAVAIDGTADGQTFSPSNTVDRQKSYGYRMFIPAAGPFIALPRVNSATGGLFTALLGAAQVAGLGLGIAGAVRLGKYRKNIGITAAPTPGGMHTGITLRF